MHPKTCPTPGKVNLPTQPLLELVTNLLSACSFSGLPMKFSASLSLNPNTSPHLHLDFIEVLDRKNVFALNANIKHINYHYQFKASHLKFNFLTTRSPKKWLIIYYLLICIHCLMLVYYASKSQRCQAWHLIG